MSGELIDVPGYIMILTYAAFAMACGYANWRRSKSIMGSISLIFLSFLSIMILKYDVEIKNMIAAKHKFSYIDIEKSKKIKEESLLFTN